MFSIRRNLRSYSLNSAVIKQNAGIGNNPQPAFSSCVLVEIVSLLEFVDASTGVNKFLFAREVRMACRAGVDRHLLLRRTGLDDVAARAGNRRVAVGRMDVFLHFSSTFRN